jgi:hypothetical protein
VWAVTLVVAIEGSAGSEKTTTPGDFSADGTLLSLWTKKMNVEVVLDALGNAPAGLINAASGLRNPLEILAKYPQFFVHSLEHGPESTLEFFAPRHGYTIALL